MRPPAHRRFEFTMPAPPAVVFDAFHYDHWRRRWDSLVRRTRVNGGAPCPFVGATTDNAGKGVLRLFALHTRFVTFDDPPRVAAASLVEPCFPFTRWAASMRHRAAGRDESILIYTYTFETGPKIL